MKISLRLLPILFLLVACESASNERLYSNGFLSCSELQAHLGALARLSAQKFNNLEDRQAFAEPSSGESDQNSALEEGDILKQIGNHLVALDREVNRLRLFRIDDPSNTVMVDDISLEELNIRGAELVGYQDQALILFGAHQGMLSYRKEGENLGIPDYEYSGSSIIHFEIADNELSLKSRLDLSSQYSQVRVSELGKIYIFQSASASLNKNDQGVAQPNDESLLITETLGVKRKSSSSNMDDAELCDCDKFYVQDSYPESARSFVQLTHVHEMKLTESGLSLVHKQSFLGDRPHIRATTEAFLFGFPVYSNDPWITIGSFNPSDSDTRLLLLKERADGLKIEASTELKGGIESQFNMDYRRSETGEFVNVFANWKGDQESPVRRTRLYSYALKKSKLELVHTIDDLGTDEFLYASLFGNRWAYAVTSTRLWDPLYVIDLKSPGEPLLASEFEIDGFATQLREVENSRLMSIGQDAHSNPYLALYDISDTGEASLVERLVFESSFVPAAAPSWFSSENYKAYTFETDIQILALPIHKATKSGVEFFVFGEGIESLGFMDESNASVERVIRYSDYFFSLSSADLIVTTTGDPSVVVKKISF